VKKSAVDFRITEKQQEEKPDALVSEWRWMMFDYLSPTIGHSSLLPLLGRLAPVVGFETIDLGV
jgi:hypothetical protein